MISMYDATAVGGHELTAPIHSNLYVCGKNARWGRWLRELPIWKVTGNGVPQHKAIQGLQSWYSFDLPLVVSAMGHTNVGVWGDRKASASGGITRVSRNS